MVTSPPAGRGQDLVAVAARIAREAHAGQADKQGRDYYTHHLLPIARLLRPYGDEACAAGLLHDVLEDAGLSPETLLAAGIPPVVVAAVESVSRRQGETYPQLIARAAAHPLGRLVKLADNWHNLSGLDDLAASDPEAAQRLRARYVEARRVLVAALLASGG